jgi:hypothetical protein
MRRLLRLALPLGLLAALAVPTSASAQATVSTNNSGGLALLASSPTTSRQNTDMAFWGNTLVQGDSRGIRVFDISNPASPTLLSDFACSGAYGDVSIWNTLVFRSTDVPQTTDDCTTSTDTLKTVTGGNHTNVPQATTMPAGFEGISIINIANPTAPVRVGAVATDCGSHTHTLVPDTANNRVFLYVSSFPNVGLDATPTAYGNTCELLAAGSPAPPNQVSGHSKITIIEVPLGNPAGAHVVNEVALDLQGYDPYFSYLPAYTGDFNNTPGYKGCHDITVFMPTHTAAAACVTEGLTLDITDPANPTVKDTYVNSYIDLCAIGVYRWSTAQGTTAAPANCMWSTATFSYDGKYIVWGDLASGYTGCNSNSTTAGHTCNHGGNTQVGVDRFYDGTSVTNECDTGGGGPNRSPLVRGAFWTFAADDPSWPVSSFKVPYSGTDATLDRYERYSNQGCTSGLMNMIPVNGAYLMPAAWHLAGVDVVNWGDPTDIHGYPSELGWFDVDTTASETGNADGTNRPAGDSAERSNAWAAYWYNGHIYTSYDSPMNGSWNPAGSRGLEVFALNDPSVAGAFDLPHLNPQTIEYSLKCSASITGKLRAGKKGTAKVTVKVLGQGVLGASVRAKASGFNQAKNTAANGTVSFTLKPKKAGKLNVTVATQDNMAGCSASKAIAKKAKKKKKK